MLFSWEGWYQIDSNWYEPYLQHDQFTLIQKLFQKKYLKCLTSTIINEKVTLESSPEMFHFNRIAWT